MGAWVKVGSYDWRGKSHSLAGFDVTEYLNLDTGENRYEYKGRLYVYDKDRHDYIKYETTNG